MKFEAILAMSQNRVIGKDGKIPWTISEDLKIFKKITFGHRVIMGRKTFESLNKKSLVGRENIVISRQKQVHADFSFYQNISSLIQNLEKQILKLATLSKKKNFVIGGQEIFQIFLPLQSRCVFYKDEGDSKQEDRYLLQFFYKEKALQTIALKM